MKSVTIQYQHKPGVTCLQFLVHPAGGIEKNALPPVFIFQLSKINVAENAQQVFIVM